MLDQYIYIYIYMGELFFLSSTFPNSIIFLRYKIDFSPQFTPLALYYYFNFYVKPKSKYTLITLMSILFTILWLFQPYLNHIFIVSIMFGKDVLPDENCAWKLLSFFVWSHFAIVWYVFSEYLWFFKVTIIKVYNYIDTFYFINDDKMLVMAEV